MMHPGRHGEMAYTADSKSAACEGVWVQVPLPASVFWRGMNNLLFALGTVAPVFLVVAVGYATRRRGVLTKEFSDVSARFNFKFCFPAMVFDSLYTADFNSLFTIKDMFLALASVVVVLGIGWLAGFYLYRQDRQARGSFIQGSFRGNIVLLGLPMALQVLGEGFRAQAAIFTTIIVTAYNVFSVFLLAAHAAGDRKPGLKTMLRSILTNPMIIGVACALPFALTGTGLPRPVSVFIRYFAVMTVPLALLDIGAGMTGRTRPASAGKVLAASVIKTALAPLLYGAVFYLGGASRENVAIMIILGSTPTAMASFTMAKVMGCNAELAGDIVLVSTLMSAFTIAAAIVFLRSAGLA